MPLDLERVRRRLPDREIHWHAVVDSTMYEATRLAQTGCLAGTAVGAEEQTAGIGRHGRSWHSEPGAGLYVSVILRPAAPPERLPLLTLAVGLAAQEAVLRAAGVACDLRWPNDLLAGSRKCAGILLQLEGAGAVVAGIGINVNHTAFPEEIASTATSLRLAAGRECSREDLLVELLPAIDRFAAVLSEEGSEAILRLFSAASSYVSGRRVVVDQGARLIQGVTEGLDPSGYLVVRGDDGRRNVILAGGVRPA